MNLHPVEKIAEAVLYEGYMLYPYRPSSVKNQQRWNFGVLSPRSWCDSQLGSDASEMQTECLFEADSSASLAIEIRFLHLVQRKIGKPPDSGEGALRIENLEWVDRLEAGGRVLQPWQEAVERSVWFHDLHPPELAGGRESIFEFPAGEEIEAVRDANGRLAGAVVRQWKRLSGDVRVVVAPCRDHLFRIKVGVRNLTSFAGSTRESALMHSLVSAHTILGIERGRFLSLLEPPAEHAHFAAECHNVGTWPVLVDDQAETVLSSPIILYDHPQIAPESAGNLFDSTEIDEILSLRILTLTDDEKQEMRHADDRTRAILERTESMPEEQFRKLHGVLRGLTPLSEEGG